MNLGIWPCPDIQKDISGLILFNRINAYSSQYIIQKNSTKWRCRAIHSKTKNFKMATTEHGTKYWALWDPETCEASAGCWSRCWGLCESCVLFTHSRTMQCSADGWGKAECTSRQFWKPVCRTQQRPHLVHLRAQPGECFPAQLSILALSQNNELFFFSLPQWSLTTSLRASPFQTAINSFFPSRRDPEPLHSKELHLSHFCNHSVDKHQMRTYSAPHSTPAKTRRVAWAHKVPDLINRQ